VKSPPTMRVDAVGRKHFDEAIQRAGGASGRSWIHPERNTRCDELHAVAGAASSRSRAAAGEQAYDENFHAAAMSAPHKLAQKTEVTKRVWYDTKQVRRCVASPHRGGQDDPIAVSAMETPIWWELSLP